MTEDEAKTKWCPAYRVATSGGDPSSTYEMDNRPEGGEPDEAAPHGWRRLPGTTHGISNCIGSACMAWRVAVKRAHQENAYNTPEPPEGDGWQPASPSPKNVAWWRVIPEQHIGYCGLAGPVQ